MLRRQSSHQIYVCLSVCLRYSAVRMCGLSDHSQVKVGGGGGHGRQGGCLWSQNSVMRFMVLTANGFFLLKVYVNGSCVVFCCHVFVNVNICGYLTLFIHIQNAYIHIYSLFVFTISSTARSFRDSTPFTVPYEGREAQ